ncbi:purine-nucleoside phosphorylase [uncultured Subdoligranulum sp.]|uniref:purine-nucleoside phosphorylase n=1 Tax=uncultured Subdoligranulum sp. TaxID=512298 RepID=UPI0025F38942|nr:purine-nucleoside phosphorylase [uncultured Subdoligranulum sp.]
MKEVDTAVAYLRQHLPFTPDLALVLGSGLGGLADEIENAVTIPYRDVPGFPVSTALGHAGQFVAGQLGGKNVLCMQGRFHYYEGHEMSAIALPVRVFKALGCRALVLTNAAGGVNWDFNVGDFMLITDHINFMGANPLRGANDDSIGPRFCDMTQVYAPDLQSLALRVAKEQNLVLQKGVYLGYMGPSFETPAEIRAFRTLGADAVGMSTVPEAIAASHCGLPVLGLSLITNMAAGMAGKRLSGDEVIEIANQRGVVFQKLVRGIVEAL